MKACLDSSKNQYQLIINSNKLDLTENAIVDNTGGYVDIFEDYHYLKNEKKVFKLNGVVDRDYKNSMNQFRGFVDGEVFNGLKKSQQLKFIQKINLEKDNDLTTTNVLKVVLEEKCE